MTLLQDGLIAFLSAVGVTTLVWIVAGAFFRAGRPAVPGLLLVLPLRGEALAMECGSCGACGGACPGPESCWRTVG